jgi:NAD(P)-dependent dehydrogenase (short-subunit alcohol dehydrogenase family)
MRLQGKVAIVTGGASGIGEGTCRRFAEEGATVIVADLDEAGAQKVAADIGGVGVRCDVAVEADIEASVKLATERYGRLDVYFANAGMGGVGGSIADLDVDGFDRTVAVLMRGVALGMKHAARVMIPQGSGSIISTASVAGLMGGYGPPIYSGCKSAVIGMTRAVARELSPLGIRVNAICPGAILTNIFAAGLGVEGEAAEQLKAVLEESFPKAQPVPRTGMPTDIANAALWLASDDSTFVTGQALVIDGGLTSVNPNFGQQLGERMAAAMQPE